MNDTLSPAIVVEGSGAIAVVRFNKPTKRNPLSSTVLDTLDKLLSRLIDGDNIEAIVFTGSAGAFLSGADIRQLATLDQLSARAFSQKGQSVMQRIADAKQVTIAAINGYCVGGGMDLALACDIRVASSTATFAHPGARLGIITAWGGTQRLPRLIGKSRALQLFTTGRRLPSAEALKVGLITEIHDPVLEGAISMARRLVTTS